MALTPTEVQAIATAEAAKFQYVSLHTADPGTTGANEATGGSPAYARKLSTWTASAGVVSGTQVTVDVPAGTYWCWIKVSANPEIDPLLVPVQIIVA